MVRKRVILANNSRLLQDMLRHVIDKTDHLEVVREIASQEELPSVIECSDPEWVITSLPFDNGVYNWLDICMVAYPAVRFILFSHGGRGVTMKSQTSYEEDLTNLSIQEFIHVLEKDLQHI
ncbi:MAG TPA: hypothetical protein VHP14_14170 [Anaerolineales bacterium]|nr:hypothetical protein [Anaerolineales bacterium]